MYFAYFVGTVHINFQAKSGDCSSKNGRVIALGTKEDTYYIYTSTKSGVQTLSSFFIFIFLYTYFFLRIYVITYIRNYVITQFILRNLSGQSIRTSMQNLESVAQKMAELLHQVRKRTLIYYYHCPNFRTNELKVWTVLSTEDILLLLYNKRKCSLSYLVQ